MNDWISALQRFPVTMATCLLAVAATLTWWLGGNVSAYMMGPELWRGEVWRPLTTVFPHVNLFHLAFNLYWTFRFGLLVEGQYGRARTALLFAGLAAGSSLASYAAFEDGVGLSGLGYGLFGLLWTLRRRDTRFRGAFDDVTAWLFVAWFFLCIALTWARVWNIGNVAHGSGAVLGWLLGNSLGNLARRKRLFASILAASCLLAFAGSLSRGSPWAMAAGLSTASWHPRERARVQAYEGTAALARGDSESAIRLLRWSLSSDPGDWRVWYNLGYALEGAGRDREAAEAYRGAIENARGGDDEKPFLREAWKFLADRARRGGDPKGAVTLYHKALDAGRDDAEAWHGLGLCLELTGDRAAAVNAFRRAFAIDGANPVYKASLDRAERDGR